MLLVSSLSAFAGDWPVISQVNELFSEEKYQEAFTTLEKALPAATGDYRAAVLTEMSRTSIKLGTALKKSGATQSVLLAHYEKGEAYAQEALKLNPNSAQAWYWKSSNMGRWGQTKGVLDSLFKAGDMKADLEKVLKLDPEMGDAYYVLGIMYQALPGWPVSFGNIAWSVSFARKSLTLMKEEPVYDYSLELAKHLWARNWEAGKRRSEQAGMKAEFLKVSSAFEKGAYFESQVVLSNQSDRQEAYELVKKTIELLEAIGVKKKSQVDDLAGAKTLLASMGR